MSDNSGNSGNSNNGNSGGGGGLWLVDFAFDMVNKRRIKKHNQQSRGLEQYKSITTDVLFPIESYNESILISGGSVDERMRFSEQILSNCVTNNQPMIILHVGNSGLEQMVGQRGYGMTASKYNKQFDVFTSFSLPEMFQIMMDTCKSKYDIKPAGRYILQIVHELLTAKKQRPYFANCVNVPLHQLSAEINNALAGSLITQDAADNLNSLLMMGQAEIPKIDSFFYDIKAQCGHVQTDKPGGTSILSAIKNSKILCIDLNSSGNTLLVELIVNSLTIAMNRGFGFTFFLDDVAAANNELLKNALCQRSGHNSVICSKDFYALMNGNDNAFNTLVGEAEKTVLLSHGSHISCEKWSKFIGEYDKIDVQKNTTGGWSHQHGGYNYGNNYGQTTMDKREFKIKPEEINRLSASEVIVYDNQTGSLFKTQVV
ncbi:MAG: hypothetical protein FWG91_08955 [Lachnospiraceae bacterium]|nr:hypothetical protein [Lachnospiraceae bacterium]